METGAVIQMMAATATGATLFWTVAADLTKAQEKAIEQSNKNIDLWLKEQQ